MKSLRQQAKEAGIGVGTLYARLHRGMTLKDALSTPVKTRKQNAAPREPSARQVAKEAGDQCYTGRPCKYCQGNMRYVSNAACAACNGRYDGKTRAVTPVKSIRHQQWV